MKLTDAMQQTVKFGGFFFHQGLRPNFITQEQRNYRVTDRNSPNDRKQGITPSDAKGLPNSSY
jgi:hypothetical protein